MFEYYNEEEKKIRESIPVIIASKNEGSFIFKDVKKEIRNYFKERKFILTTLPSREARFFDRYYGISYQGETMTLKQVGDLEGVTRERVRQILAKAIRNLKNPDRLKACVYLKDEDFGFTNKDITWLEATTDDLDHESVEDEMDEEENAVDENTSLTLEIVKRKCLEKINKINVKRCEFLSEEEKEADFVLNQILTKLVDKEMNLSDYEMKQLNLFLYPNEKLSYESLLRISTKRLQEKNLQFVIDKIHEIGLHFMDEVEFQEDWENLCRKGIIGVGVEELKNKFNINSKEISKKAVVFSELMNLTLEEMDLSVRTYNCMKRAGKETLRDVVKMSETQLIRVRNLGRRSFDELIGKVKSYGLDIRPEEMDENLWINQLKSRFNIEEVDKIVLEEIEEDVKEEANSRNDDKFTRLMKTKIEDLDFSLRTYNCISRSGKKTLEDVVRMSEEQLIRVRNIGKVSIVELIDRIKSHGLELRPEGVLPEDWIKQLRSRFTVKEYDIEEIPEKYRKAYVIGAGVIAEQEAKQKSRGLVSKALEKSKLKVESDDSALPKLKINKQDINDFSDENILKIIAEDITAIKDLDSSFIVRYRKELIKIVLEDSNLDTEKRFNLIERINNTTIYSV